MIRLRVSDLDQWVRFIEPERPEFEMETDTFLKQMRREEPPSDDMAAGKAFHTLLEHAQEGQELGLVEGVECEGFRFHFDGDFALALPAIREPEVMERVFQTPAGPALLRGRIDGRDRFNTVIDWKLSKSFDAERYARSLQWRAYLLMVGAKRFRYTVFQAKRKNRDVFIYAVHDFEQWAYPGMADEVHRRVSELAEFVAVHVPELVEPSGPVEAMAADIRRLS